MADQSNNWSDDIDRMEEVLRVYEELGGERADFDFDLVTPWRRHVLTEDITLRYQAKKTKKDGCRLYLFRDLMLLAEKKKTGLLRKKSSGQGGLNWLGNVRKNSSGSLPSDLSSSSGEGGSYKLKAYMPLGKVSVKSVYQDEKDGSWGFKLTYVSREVVKGDKHGSMKVLTHVDRTEIFLGSEEKAEQLMRTIIDTIDELKEAEEQQRKDTEEKSLLVGDAEGQETDEASSTGKKKKKWAKAKDTMKSRRAGSGNSSRDGSGSMDSGSDTNSMDAGGLTLDDLAKRYKVDFDQPSNKDEVAEFSVSFGEGSMGFSLTSARKAGVIVGNIAIDSLADKAGVTIGDRLVEVEGHEITDEMSWSEAVEIIKACERPVRIKFRRAWAVAEAVEKQRKEEEERKKKEGPRKRNWTKRLDRHNSGSRALTLEELEKSYKSRVTGVQEQDMSQIFGALLEKSNDVEKKCIRVLEEIHNSEEVFVADLFRLIADYITPIKRAQRRLTCKEAGEHNNNPFCQHRKPRVMCNGNTDESVSVLPEEDTKTIFINIDTLVKVNAELLKVIQTGIATKYKETDGNMTVADLVLIYSKAFSRIAPFFKMYSLYCGKYTAAIDRLVTVKAKNKEFRDLLAQRERKGKNATLTSLLIKPVQRICKYPLLFQELIRSMNDYIIQEAHKGTQGLDDLIDELDKTYTIVDKIADDVNSKVAEQDQLQGLIEVYIELGGKSKVPDLVIPTRRYIEQRDVQVGPSHNPEQVDFAVSFLFNDLVIFAKPIQTTSTLRKRTTMSKKGTSASGSISKTRTHGSGAPSRKSSDESGSKTSGGRTRGSIPPGSFEIVYMLDLRMCTASAIAKPNDENQYGFAIVFKGRTTETVKDKTKKKTKGESNTKTIHKTTVDKCNVWCFSLDERDELLGLINKQLLELADEEVNNEKAKEAHGSKANKKKKKSYKSGKAGLSLGKTDGGTAARQAALKEKLAQKKASRTGNAITQ